MEKVKFETKEDFLEYCKTNKICNIPRKYGSQCCDFYDGIERKTMIDGRNYINEEPKKYPCILVFAEFIGFIDEIYGMFIYPEDFN